MVMLPLPSIASTAFFMRFSITHSNNGAHILTSSGSEASVTVNVMREEILVAIYDAAPAITLFTSAFSIFGRDPILENLDAIVLKRFTSLFISRTVSGSTPIDCNNSIQAISDEIGVPSWWAVSFDRPTHTLFCSARRVELTAK